MQNNSSDSLNLNDSNSCGNIINFLTKECEIYSLNDKEMNDRLLRLAVYIELVVRGVVEQPLGEGADLLLLYNKDVSSFVFMVRDNFLHGFLKVDVFLEYGKKETAQIEEFEELFGTLKLIENALNNNKKLWIDFFGVDVNASEVKILELTTDDDYCDFKYIGESKNMKVLTNNFKIDKIMVSAIEFLERDILAVKILQTPPIDVKKTIKL